MAQHGSRYDLISHDTANLGHTWRGSSLEHTSGYRTFEQRANQATAEAEARRMAEAAAVEGPVYGLVSDREAL